MLGPTTRHHHDTTATRQKSAANPGEIGHSSARAQLIRGIGRITADGFVIGRADLDRASTIARDYGVI
jgi:hypothetical protein